MSKVVYSPEGYNIGSAHYVEKDKEYEIVDTLSGKRSALKGSSLIARINKETKFKNYTLSNVQYGCKPPIYMDTVLSEVKCIKFNPANGNFSASFKCPFRVTSAGFNGGNYAFLSLGGVCLDFEIRKAPMSSTGDWYLTRYLSADAYELYSMNSGVVLKIDADMSFRGIVLNNIDIQSDTILKFDFVVLLYTTDTNRDISKSIPVVIDASNGMCKAGNKPVKLMSVEQFAKMVLMQSNDFANEYLFKKDSRLSNYFECPVFYDNRQYRSSEAAYQSMKSADPKVRDKFTNLSADEARQLGWKIQNSSDLREDWFRINYAVMEDVVRAKMKQNGDCFSELLATRGQSLVEDTTGWHDITWGRCYCPKCKGDGSNWLGKILTKIRIEYTGD